MIKQQWKSLHPMMVIESLTANMKKGMIFAMSLMSDVIKTSWRLSVEIPDLWDFKSQGG